MQNIQTKPTKPNTPNDIVLLLSDLDLKCWGWATNQRQEAAPLEDGGSQTTPPPKPWNLILLSFVLYRVILTAPPPFIMHCWIDCKNLFISCAWGGGGASYKNHPVCGLRAILVSKYSQRQQKQKIKKNRDQGPHSWQCNDTGRRRRLAPLWPRACGPLSARGASKIPSKVRSDNEERKQGRRGGITRKLRGWVTGWSKLLLT